MSKEELQALNDPKELLAAMDAETSPEKRQEKAAALQKALQATPAGFVEYALGLPLYPWQSRALTALEHAQGPKGKVTQIAVASPNEGGKSSRIVAGAALYWVTIHPRGKVAITTKDAKQLNEQIIPAIEQHRARLGFQSVRSPYYRLTTPTGGVLVAYTTDDAGRVEGLHSDGPAAPLMWIVDEAKSVDEPIFQGIDRCGYKVLLYTSSPGLMQGTFYNAFTKNRSGFITIQAGLKDCPHISPEKVNRIIEKYGEDHPFTRSSVYGEFMEQDEANRFVVPLSSLQRCLQNPPQPRAGLTAAFCDFAAGGDENVLALRKGNRITLEACWRETNKMAAVGRFIQLFRKHNLEPDQIYGDASAKDMLDLMAEAGWQIHRMNFGQPANEKEIYISWGAEAWLEAANQIEKCEVILPDDESLIAQLTTRQKTINARGKLCIEEKYQMAKRNLPSPDRADAVVGVMAARDLSLLNQKQPFSVTGWRDELANQGNNEVLEEIGACAGL